MKQFKYINNMFYLGASDFRCDSGMFNDMAKPAALLLQYETPMVHFFEYVPKRVVNVSAEVAYARKFIYAFKNGSVDESIWAAELVSAFLHARGLVGKEYTFIAVPASTQERHEARYSHFMREVCRLANLNNGYGLVNVTSDREQVHRGGRRNVLNFTVDKSIAGRKVVLFDDVCTTLQSWTTFAAMLESMDADVVQGVFLAQTSRCHY